jgi:hypothetical protein
VSCTVIRPERGSGNGLSQAIFRFEGELLIEEKRNREKNGHEGDDNGEDDGLTVLVK